MHNSGYQVIFSLPTHRSLGTRLLLSIKLKRDLNLNRVLSKKVNESYKS